MGSGVGRLETSRGYITQGVQCTAVVSVWMQYEVMVNKISSQGINRYSL